MSDKVDRTETLLAFFKLLADEKRLQIIGLLARQEYTVEEMATILNLSSATVSHHLRRLESAGLVSATARQHYHVYALRLDSLHALSQQVFTQDALQNTTENLDLDAYDRKILRDYMEDDRLRQIPRQWKKREVILRYLLEQFQLDRRYTEAEVNEVIECTYEDYATLRRLLIDSGRMDRDHEIYWRVE